MHRRAWSSQSQPLSSIERQCSTRIATERTPFCPRNNRSQRKIMPSVLYLAGHGSPAFEAGRTTVDVVCASDSITGWNNFGVVRDWPYRTYPESLQRLCDPLGLTVANGGIAGEVSPNGLSQVQDYLDLFPNARYF